MKQLLFVNACLRGRRSSRTLRLCEALLDALQAADPSLSLCEVNLGVSAPAPLCFSEIEYREALSPEAKQADPALSDARVFASADLIVVGAPYWDLSFPAVLKAYIERICVNGLTFRYTEEGRPEGLCRARRMAYITTAGGFLGDANYGGDYLRAIAQMLGVEQMLSLACEGLDIQGLDAEATLANALAGVPALCRALLAQ